MRDQYAGDISDFLKFAFLRALVGEDRQLGVAWYYIPDNDGRADGRHTEWREQMSWHQLDPELHSALAKLPERSVAELERAPIWPRDVLFHREPVPARSNRATWSMQKRSTLESARVVFLDPDNGLGRESRKHATIPELRMLRKQMRTIVFIKFPGRQLPHTVLVDQLHSQLAHELKTTRILTVRTNISVPRESGSKHLVQRQRWFTVIDFDDEISERAKTFAERVSVIPHAKAYLDRMK